MLEKDGELINLKAASSQNGIAVGATQFYFENRTWDKMHVFILKAAFFYLLKLSNVFVPYFTEGNVCSAVHIRLTCTEDKRVLLWDGNNKSCYGISQHHLLDSKLTIDKNQLYDVKF